MKMSRADALSLQERLARNSIPGANRYLHAARSSFLLSEILQGSTLSVDRFELAGRSILIATRGQLAAALTLIELDGVASRLILCLPNMPHDYLSRVIRDADVDAIIMDDGMEDFVPPTECLRVICRPVTRPLAHTPNERRETEWVLFTSGTAGAPKMVRHTLAGLAGAIKAGLTVENSMVWATFYDVRRYGGLQIFLRAIFNGTSFVLSDENESIGDHLVRLAARGATHVTGTPTHWRRALMSPQASAISPRYVRLSGEIADQAILDSLRRTYGNARVVHAYASTEAGVGFEVVDCQEGFPVDVIQSPGEVTYKVEDGSLRIRSRRTALGYVGADAQRLADADGFIDTGDMVERRGDRYYFLGRRDAMINVGGLKVHPEEVEAVIDRHPGVRMAQVRARKNPMTGAVVVADVILREPLGNDVTANERLKNEILRLCRDTLAPHKVPAAIRFVDMAEIAESGKLARRQP